MRDKLPAASAASHVHLRLFTRGRRRSPWSASPRVVVGGFFFTTWAAKPSYAPLFTQPVRHRRGAIVDQLNSEGRRTSWPTAARTIMVPKDEVYEPPPRR